MFSLTVANPFVLILLPLVAGWAAWLWLQDRGNLSPARHRLALALRLAILSALILVLAGATWLQPERRQATIFVADLSASTAGAREREISFINRALRTRGQDDVAAVVAVGGDALVEQPIATLKAFGGFQSLVERSATNLETGLNLAGALFPAGYRKRVVLLTDGQQNQGDAATAARLLRDEGVRVDVVPLAPANGPEALVSGVDVPASLRRGASVPLSVSLSSSVAQQVTLDVSDASDNNRLLRRLTVTLPAGASRVSITLPPLGEGFHRLHVQIEPSRDTVAENNEGDAITRVRGAPRVLVAAGMPGEGSIVAAALRAKGMRVQQIAGYRIEPSTAYLSQYDAVMLIDVPAFELDTSLLDPQHSPLRSYVDGGGGLVVLGGPNSYGVGGYTDTAFDDLLPVSMKLPQRKDTPSVAVALIIEDLESNYNVNISKAAGEGVVKLLTPLDRVEVNDATGTDSPNGGWAVPLQYVTNKAEIDRAIDAMNPIDPMSYAPSLQAAYNTLRKTNARIKHIILLGDGDAEDNYYPLVRKIRQAGITVSTVATGAGGFGPSDYGTMQNIARWGGGRYYQADNVNAIPTIFLKETKQVARTGLVEEHFVPDLYSTSPIVHDIPAFPLDGYVATTPKPAAEQILMHTTKHGNDPILAQWQYGLGRVVVWTSDARGEWTASVVGQKAINGALWANMVSWVLPPESSANLQFSSSIEGGQAHLTVTTNGLPADTQVQARVDGPGRSATIPLLPTAPGQYEADIAATTPGAYLVGIKAVSGGHTRTLRTGLVIPYAPEYRDTGLNMHLLSTVTALAGGAILRDPAASFADNLPAVYAPRPLTTPLLLLALLLLPCDVATRRLLIGLAEIREALAALARRRQRHPAAVPSSAAAGAPLVAVRSRRAQRRERLGETVAAVASNPASAPLSRPSASTPPPQPARPVRVATPAARPAGSMAPAAAQARPAPDAAPEAKPPAAPGAPEPTGPASTAGKLLEAKRQRRRR